MIHIRVTDAEKTALDKLAARYGVKRSALTRRLVREAIRGRANYFEDGVKELYSAHRELSAIGRNLNQIAARLNAQSRRGAPSEPGQDIEGLSEILRATQIGVKGLKDVMSAEVSAATRRTLKALELPE